MTETSTTTADHSSLSPGIELAAPVKGEGRIFWQLARASGVLDENSEYCYHLLQLHHAHACVLARHAGKPVGFIVGYLPGSFQYGTDINVPHDAAGRTLFIWQLAVDPGMRGSGLARAMTDSILARPECQSVRYIQATVTPDNRASTRFFQSLAARYEAQLTTQCLLNEQELSSDHEPEHLFHIGPIHRKNH